LVATTTGASACLPVTLAGRGRASAGRWPPGGSPSNRWGLVIRPWERAALTARPGRDPGGARRRLRGRGPLRWDLGLFVGAPGAAFANRGMGRWYACTMTGTSGSPKLHHVRRIVRQHNRQAARAATRRAIGWAQALPGGARTAPVALHSQSFLLLGRLGGAGPKPNHPRACGRGGCCSPVTAGGASAFFVRYADGRGARFPCALRDSPSARGPGFPARHGPGCGPGGEASPGPGAAAQRRAAESLHRTASKPQSRDRAQGPSDAGQRL
jgi:hypothetical protein